MPAHPLDRPVWSALSSRWRPLALGDGRALRLMPDYGPFAAAADSSLECQAALAALEPGEDGLWLVELDEAPPPAGMAVALTAACCQMVARAITPGEQQFAVTALAERDAPQMLALARLTRPGPFLAMTHRLGAFVGVKQDERLVAMAGERMQPDGFTEINGVCTHPDHRGRGYAGALMRAVAERVLARGEVPFLHVYAGHDGAIALYRSIGFQHRRQVVLTVLGNAG